MTDAANLTDLAAQTENLHEHFEERSAILEHDAGLPGAGAELEAARIVGPSRGTGRICGRACDRPWRDTPLCCPRCPTGQDRSIPYPFGTATVHVREDAKPGPVSGSIVITEAEIEAARNGRTVVRQGDFTGAPEVKL